MAMDRDWIAEQTDRALAHLLKIAGEESENRIREEMGRRVEARHKEAAQAVDEPAIAPPGVLVLKRLPTSHNALYTPVIRDGHATLILSDAAREWTAWAENELAIQWPHEPITGEVDVQVLFQFGDRRRRDAANLEKLLWDVLEGVCYTNDAEIADKVIRRRIVPGAEAGALVAVRPHFPHHFTGR